MVIVAGMSPTAAAIVRLTPRPTDLRPLTIRAYQRDAEFDRWFDGIANLDALDRAAAHARLLADPALGASPARREARLKLLRRLAQVFGLIAVGVAIWVFVWPRPAPWAVVAGLGLVPVMIGLVWLSGGRLVIGYDKAEPRPSVVLGLAAAPAVLLRTFQFPIHQWPLALGESAVAAVVVLALVLLLDARWAVLRLPRWILALWLTVYGFGAVAFINREADQTAPKTYHALVQRKSPPGLALGDWDLGGWDVGLGSWDDVGQPGAEFVTRAIYDKLAVGEYACVGLHPGALGVWWYDVQACSPTAKEPVTFSLVAEMPTADDMAYMYPDFAQRHNFEGHTRFRCTITATGGLTDCVILLEDPPGMGFGAATLRLASTFKMKTRMPDGSSTAGKVYISGVRWRLPRQ